MPVTVYRVPLRRLLPYGWTQVAGRLGRVKVAERALLVAHDPRQAPKPRAVMDVLRAEVLAKSGQVDEACRVAAEAFDIGRTYDSERVTRAVASFRNSLGIRVGRATAELDERLYATYREDL
jgi:hypothetical protein